MTNIIVLEWSETCCTVIVLFIDPFLNPSLDHYQYAFKVYYKVVEKGQSEH